MRKFVLFFSLFAVCMGCRSWHTIFEDDFNSQNSYETPAVPNATVQEYGENALQEGHLLKKWNYSWTYDPSGDWKQAFYVVPVGKDYMEQAGRSAHFGNYRLVADSEIPSSASKYEIRFKQWKNDNDPVFFLLGTDGKGDGGVRFGYENQLPESDKTVDTVYMRGALGKVQIPGKSYFRKWAEHTIQVNVPKKEVSWAVNGETLVKAKVENLKPGGHFAFCQHYERGTRYDDIEIKVFN